MIYLWTSLTRDFKLGWNRWYRSLLGNLVSLPVIAIISASYRMHTKGNAPLVCCLTLLCLTVEALYETVLKHVIMGGIAGVPLKIVIFPPADIMLPPCISKSLEAPNNPLPGWLKSDENELLRFMVTKTIRPSYHTGFPQCGIVSSSITMTFTPSSIQRTSLHNIMFPSRQLNKRKRTWETSPSETIVIELPGGERLLRRFGGVICVGYKPKAFEKQQGAYLRRLHMIFHNDMRGKTPCPWGRARELRKVGRMGPS